MRVLTFIVTLLATAAGRHERAGTGLSVAADHA